MLERKSKLLHALIRDLNWGHVYEMMDDLPGLVNYTTCESCFDEWTWVREATPLFCVTELVFKEKCEVAVVVELLRRGADPNKVSVYDGIEAYPLFLCAVAVPGHYDVALEMAQLLVTYGAHVNGTQSMLNLTIDRMLRTPYRMDDATMISFFCKAGACARSKQTAIVDILGSDKPWVAEVVELLLEYGAYLYSLGTTNWTPYAVAANNRTDVAYRIMSLHDQLEEIKTFDRNDFVKAVHHSDVLDAPINQWCYYVKGFDEFIRPLKRNAFATTMLGKLKLLQDTHDLVKQFLTSEKCEKRLKKWANRIMVCDQAEL